MVRKLGRGIGVPVFSGAGSQDHWSGKALTPLSLHPAPSSKSIFV